MGDENRRNSIEGRIYPLRGSRVVLDLDLAEIYGVTTKRLNEQIKRNRDRFPADFMFQLTIREVSDLRSQFATAKWTMRRAPPYAFTEHGALMVANVLNSPLAINASILVIRAFIRVREVVAEHLDLKRRLTDLERKLAKGFADHEDELREIRFLISALEQPTEDKEKRRLVF